LKSHNIVQHKYNLKKIGFITYPEKYKWYFSSFKEKVEIKLTLENISKTWERR